MSNIDSVPNIIRPELPYCVWYVTGAAGEELEDITRELQIHQDMMVVLATSDIDAIQQAAALLAERCDFEFVITKVANREHLEFILSTALGRVERGEVPPASLADEDHYVWAERYVYCTKEKKPADDAF